MTNSQKKLFFNESPPKSACDHKSDFREQIEKSLSDFLENPPEQIILWGPDDVGKRCLEWLKYYNLHERVKFFVYNGTNNCPEIFCEKKVYNFEDLNKCDYEDSTIIICIARNPFNVMEYLGNNHYVNQLYFFVSRKPAYYFGEEYSISNLKEAYNYYETDDTETYNNLVLYEHLIQNNMGAVFSLDLINILPKTKVAYWETANLNL